MRSKEPLRTVCQLFLGFTLGCTVLFAQSDLGELRLMVVDPSGSRVKTEVLISSAGNQYRNALATNEQGSLNLHRLPYGVYAIEIQHPGFAPVFERIDIHSSVPIERTIQLRLPSVTQKLTVNATDTLIDPQQPASVNVIGTTAIRDRLSSIPGRSLQDLVNSQPGWLYEGNAVLHPRGSEYQTQFVVDGVPLTDDRSPGSGPAIDADDVESVSVYTSGIPAEYGRKMGGVVEVNTLRNAQPGWHGQVALSGGSFDSDGASAQAQTSWGGNTFGGSASGSMTDRYLNPVVPQNFSNTGTLGDFAVHYERDLTQRDRVQFLVRHEVARYDIPNEFLQQAAGQRQTADNIETFGIASYQHTFSSDAVADFHVLARDNAAEFKSNANSDPVEVFQQNSFREAYFRGTTTIHHGRHEWKFGFESDNTFLNEDLRYHITDPSRFDPGTPIDFSFAGTRPDLEQAFFVQDQIQLNNWTVRAGVRWDHYQLRLNRHAVQPRLAVSRYFPGADLLVHFSYDRIFQTPSFENILLSSSTQVESIAPGQFLRLPVEPSEGNYYEAGLSKAFAGRLRLDANYFRRIVSDFADDDQLENTAISFPISFRKASIYGVETKIEIPEWHRWSGFASYSYSVGFASFPVTGGLFLGDDSKDLPAMGRFPISQDQRNTLRGRVRFQAWPRFWVATGLQYDSGLPFEFAGDPATVATQYGPAVLNRVNFARGRILPSLLVNASAGADIYKSEKLSMRLQADGENLTNVLDVIDFGGLFSGNAIGPSRSWSLRMITTF